MTMIKDVPWRSLDWEKQYDACLNQPCECGHALYEHGFTHGLNYIAVSQCVVCKCKEFEPTNKENLYNPVLYTIYGKEDENR